MKIMKINIIALSLLSLLSFGSCSQTDRTIAFYNIENLFDLVFNDFRHRNGPYSIQSSITYRFNTACLYHDFRVRDIPEHNMKVTISLSEVLQKHIKL